MTSQEFLAYVSEFPVLTQTFGRLGAHAMFHRYDTKNPQNKKQKHSRVFAAHIYYSYLLRLIFTTHIQTVGRSWSARQVFAAMTPRTLAVVNMSSKYE
jgi:hypothetical protein